MRQRIETIEKVVSLLINGVTDAECERACVEKLEMTPREAANCMREAKKKIRSAASPDRIEQLGLSISRLQEICNRSLRAKDVKTALVAQREINRILGLVAMEGAADEAAISAESRELAAIAAHLLPLQLAPADYPLREHARVAAEIVRDFRCTPQKRL